MHDADPAPSRDDSDDGHHYRLLESIRRRVQGLTVAVVLMALAVFVLTAAVFGYLVDFHGGEGLLVGSTAIGTAVLGFLFGLGVGWFVRLK
jgi:hypothetical protein